MPGPLRALVSSRGQTQETEGTGLGLGEENAAEASLMAARVNQTPPLRSETNRCKGLLSSSGSSPNCFQVKF